MASKIENLRKIYEGKIGKKLVNKLSDDQIKLLSKYYNSLSGSEQTEIDSKILMGYNDTDLHQMASGMAEENDEPASPDPPPPPSSSALVPVGTKKTDLVSEEIDERILSILGLEDVFDFTYEEYLTLLKEKMAAARMTQQGMPTESVELITDEYKRVKGKTGKFKVKAKKIDINKVVDKKSSADKVQLDPKKLLPPAVEDTKKQDENENQNLLQEILDFLKGDLLDSLKSINSVVEDILTTLKEQRAVDAKKAEQERKSAEIEKKKKREAKLEGGEDKKTSDVVSKVAKPFTNFFDTIKNFFMNILLGSAINFLLSVIKDPSIILTPLKNFANMIIGFLNSIISFLWNMVMSPINFVIDQINGGIKGLIDQVNKAISLIPGAKPITAPQLPKVPDAPQIPTIPVQQQEGGGETINIGDISLMSGGGVDNNTGVKISGFGKDTQLTALSPGEVVISNPAADFWGRDNLLAMNAMGGGTNKPKFGSLGIQAMQGGGVAGGGKIIFGAGHAARSKGSKYGTDGKRVHGTQDPTTKVSESEAMMHLIDTMKRIVSSNPQRYSNIGFHNITDTSGPTGMRATTKRIEGQGNQFIELHLDQWGGGGRSGVISRNRTAVDQSLGSLFGFFPKNFKEGELAIPDEGGTIVELAAVDDPKIRSFLNEVKQNKYGPATESMALKLLNAVVGKNVPKIQPPGPPSASRQKIVMAPVPVGGGQQAPTSAASPTQPEVPGFSAEDPMNMSTLVVKSIYNMVG